MPGEEHFSEPRAYSNCVLVAWFVSYWQRQKSDLSAQKYAISAGLAIATLGFGAFKISSRNLGAQKLLQG
jgi:hypothetical protein